MIPNWLLGKSKSKLQEILGGGGGGTTYTAGEGIDITDDTISVDPVLLSDIGDMSDAIPTKAAKTQISNPNLLDNPWFTVNQRRQSSYASAGYTVDRWKLSSDNMTVNVVTDNAIELIHANNNNDASLMYLFQQEDVNALRGKTVTLSVLDSNGNVYANTFTLPEELPSQQTFYGFTRIPEGSSDYFYADFMINIPGTTKFAIRIGSHVANATITIRAVKLEIGSVSTLAMDTIPNYATELLKCQRYFIRVCDGRSDRCIGIGQARSATSALIAISLPIELISWPQLVISDYTKLTLRNGDTYKTGTGAAMDSRSATTQEITIQSTGLSTGACYDAYLASGATLDFDAEL